MLSSCRRILVLLMNDWKEYSEVLDWDSREGREAGVEDPDVPADLGDSLTTPSKAGEIETEGCSIHSVAWLREGKTPHVATFPICPNSSAIGAQCFSL